MKNKSQYLGIILGVIYGLIIRIIAGSENFEDYYSIYSISFIWITPIIIGQIPILFSSNEIYKSKLKLFFFPIVTIIIFLIVALLTRIEDIFCLIVIGIPFLIISGIVGLILGAFVKDKIVNKKLYSIILIPLILNPIENLIPNKAEVYNVKSEILIYTNKENIFPNLLNVPTISDSEYSNGVYQKKKLGFPDQ